MCGDLRSIEMAEGISELPLLPGQEEDFRFH